MADVVPVDFGKEDREHARRFSRLMGLVEQREADILREPGKYLKQSYEEVSRTRMAVEQIKSTWRRAMMPKYVDYSGPITPEGRETIIVRKHEWDALQAMRREIEKL